MYKIIVKIVSLNQYLTKEIHALQIKAYTKKEFLNG